MTHAIVASFLGMAIFVTGCTGVPNGLKPVTDFEPDRYLGKWYEIARLDHSFERNLSNVSATYTQMETGDIRVQNRGFNTQTGKWKEIEGRARFIERNTVGSLKVSFFGPFYGGYHIIELDKQGYRHAMVAGPSRSYLWILSRTEAMDNALFERLVAKAKGWGFDTTRLIEVTHTLSNNGPEYKDNNPVPSTSNQRKMITPCPDKPSCVSSVDMDKKHFVQPLLFEGDMADAHQRLLTILSEFGRVQVIVSEKNFIQAEFVSSVFGFVDDVEFYFDDRQKSIQVKSASRVGFSDLGVNRRRVEKIRKLMNERGNDENK